MCTAARFESHTRDLGTARTREDETRIVIIQNCTMNNSGMVVVEP